MDIISIDYLNPTTTQIDLKKNTSFQDSISKTRGKIFNFYTHKLNGYLVIILIMGTNINKAAPILKLLYEFGITSEGWFFYI